MAVGGREGYYKEAESPLRDLGRIIVTALPKDSILSRGPVGWKETQGLQNRVAD